MSDEVFDVIIIGSGPAGLTAGIYTARADLKTLIIAGSNWGGQLMQTTLVENYPGFIDGIQGPDLMMNMRKQAEKMGAKVVEEDVQNVSFEKRPFGVSTPSKSPPNLGGESKSWYSGKAVIIATGAEFNWLGLPSEQRLIGRGVSSCATCDAAFFKNKKVIVVGGGDAAMEEALYLTKFASEVTIVHRRDSFRASKIMQDRVLSNPKIKIKWNTVVTEVVGDEKVTGVRLTSPPTPLLSLGEGGRGEVMAVDGVFVAIGHSPMTNIFKDQVELDEKGFVKRELESGRAGEYKTMTNVPGVFVAGDVHDVRYKQAITAAGYGCEAALEVEKWLSEQKS
jgi:thioredoxin reductase (NADPH)